MNIPARVHFCWIGDNLPWAYAFAILSAARRGGMDEVILHHTDKLTAGPVLEALRREPGVRLSHIDPLALLTEAGRRLDVGDGLVALYRAEDRPAKRVDILRAALLYLEGGVYLDLDTVTVASLRSLLECRQFIGTEEIVWPALIYRSRSPLMWTRVLALDGMRKILRWLPDGWRWFRFVARFYFRGVNNAVMGAEAGTALMADYLKAMLRVPPERRKAPYALGPDLLGEVVRHHAGEEVVLLPPPVAYPLPPEISEHWFRIRPHAPLETALLPETRVVHWYASIRSKSRIAEIDWALVQRDCHRQLYSKLVITAMADPP